MSSDIIKLLPDSVANRIAAGEVIVRPASVVKELLENAIDAEATEIELHVIEAGKSQILVRDNGKGMSPMDARMAFERHATSKINSAEDLYRLHSLGFRGEALASIAAVADVELKTRKGDDATGTLLQMANGQKTHSEPMAWTKGTQISVKNLFHTIPVRYKFLKSNAVELKHIYEEFVRQALAYPEITWRYTSDGNEIFQLPKTNLRQRVYGIFGKKINEQLIPVDNDSDVIRVTGFIGRPEIAKKSSGGQYLFVNRRYVRSPYMQHAITAGYEDILADGLRPFFVLFLEIDPARIDINVHPQKHELKFEDERVIYHLLKASIRHSLGKYSISTQIDFDAPMPDWDKLQSEKQQNHHLSGGKSSFSSQSEGYNWYKQEEAFTSEQAENVSEVFVFPSRHFNEKEDSLRENVFQIFNKYIVCKMKNGFLIIHQKAAHERILYERFCEELEKQNATSQSLLFPITLNLNANDTIILNALLDNLNKLRFDIAVFGEKSFIVHGIPAILQDNNNPEQLIIDIIAAYQNNITSELVLNQHISKCVAQSSSIKSGKSLDTKEQLEIVHSLFSCKLPQKSPSGKSCFIEIRQDELEKRFRK